MFVIIIILYIWNLSFRNIKYVAFTKPGGASAQVWKPKSASETVCLIMIYYIRRSLGFEVIQTLGPNPSLVIH